MNDIMQNFTIKTLTKQKNRAVLPKLCALNFIWKYHELWGLTYYVQEETVNKI